ncbi:Belongs to the MHC class I family, partial [Pristimantis euphronides]
MPYVTVCMSLSDSHTLSYCYTGVSATGFGLPEFSIIGYVDDEQIDVYTTDIGESVLVAPWMKKNERREFLKKKTQIDKEDEALFKIELNLQMKRFNVTEGLHFVQVIASCELRDDNSIDIYEQYRYDGTEYMYLDTKTVTFIPTMSQAQITTEKWNSPDVGMNHREKTYLEKECIDRLRRYLEYGREHLERRVRPKVRVTGHLSDKITKLHCLVYGFHPRAVDVKWMKNGIDDVPTYETTHVLPNPDGTYQIRVSVEVIAQEGDSYSCFVDHSSLKEPLLVKWEPEEDFPVVVTILVALILLVFVLVAFGVARFIRKSRFG